MIRPMKDLEVAKQYLGNKFTEEVRIYLNRQYGTEQDIWSLKPFFLYTWFEDDLEKIRSGEFHQAAYNRIKTLRRPFLCLASEVDEMFEDNVLTEAEAELLYDSIYCVYINRKLHMSRSFLDQEDFSQAISRFLQGEDLPFS